MSIGGPHEVLPPHRVTTRIPSSELRRHVGGPTSASEAGFLRSEAN